MMHRPATRRNPSNQVTLSTGEIFKKSAVKQIQQLVLNHHSHTEGNRLEVSDESENVTILLWNTDWSQGLGIVICEKSQEKRKGREEEWGMYWKEGLKWDLKEGKRKKRVNSSSQAGESAVLCMLLGVHARVWESVMYRAYHFLLHFLLCKLCVYFWLVNLPSSALGTMNIQPWSSRVLMPDSILQLKKSLLRLFDVTQLDFCRTAHSAYDRQVGECVRPCVY